MRTLLCLLLVVFLASCSKPDTPVAPSLVGTRWSSFSFKSVVDGSSVYNILRFTTATDVEYYSATEKTKLVGTIDNRTYTYADPNVVITANGKTFAGTVSGSTLRIFGADYTKEP